MLTAYRQMVDTWLSVGPVDELVIIIANIIIADPEENLKWIAKWKARPKESLFHPSGCLLERDDITSRLGEINCPALILHGSADTAISLDRAEALRAGLKNAEQVVVIEGAAHASNFTHSYLVNPPLEEFLDRLTS